MGNRVSPEAVARDREKSRLRAAARRANDREGYNASHLKWVQNNRERRNEVDRFRYGSDIARLASRQFVCWDGEGYSDDNGDHHYMLFGCSAMPNDPIVGRSLSTRECLDYLLYVESYNPDAWHVGYAFDYDVNMILRDLPSPKLRHLADYNVVHWQGYRLQYIPGKYFVVSRGPKEARQTVTIDDVIGFFHSKYTTSLVKFGVAQEVEIRRIIEGKLKRGNFTYEDIEYVQQYWTDEIGLMPDLMEKLRDACYDAGFYISRWYGPGVLANNQLQKHRVNTWHSHDVPVEAQIAIQTAFAGGRFQFWRCGLYAHPIYTADINSAYIYACSLLPRLDNGRWRRVVKSNIDRLSIARFGLYRIAYHTPGRERGTKPPEYGSIYPLFHRDKPSGIYWPSRTEGWYWSPEAETVALDSNAEFLEAWVYDDDGTYPFEWVNELFDQRLILQRAGNPAEKTIKWALAAMYGAYAQRVGWDKKKRLPPRKHELAWAGFITSWCRAEVYKMGRHCWEQGGLVSIDTDGVMSTVPFEPAWIERGEGEKLGQWKLEKFDALLFWQSGFYWLRQAGKWSTAKTRGLPRGTLDFAEALAAYKADPRRPIIAKKSTRFVGFKQALKLKGVLKNAWRWEETESSHLMGWGGSGRHIAMVCPKCQDPKRHGMHRITHRPPKTAISQPHKLPWLLPPGDTSINLGSIEDFDPENIFGKGAIYHDADIVDHL